MPDTDSALETTPGELEPKAADPETAPAADGPEQPADTPVTSALEPVVERLDAIEERLIETVRLGSRHAEHVERLHAENQRLKEGEIAAATMPLLRDLMRLSDDLERMTAAAGEPRDLALVRDTLLDVLRRNGLERYEPSPGEPFESARHSAIGTQPTEHPACDRTIATVLRAGFAREDGSTIRPAEVEVLRHVPEAAAPAAEDTRSIADPEE